MPAYASLKEASRLFSREEWPGMTAILAHLSLPEHIDERNMQILLISQLGVGRVLIKAFIYGDEEVVVGTSTISPISLFLRLASAAHGKY